MSFPIEAAIAPAFERADMEGTLPDRFRRIAAALPQQPAIVDGARHLTYAELDAASDRMAESLADLAAGEPVALVFGLGIEAIVALLGALKAGLPAMPIDPAVPPEGLDELLATMRRVVTEPAHAAWCAAHAGDVTVQVGADGHRGIPAGPRPEDVAVIYLTSASTGASKGVMRTHRSICWHGGLQSRHHGYGPGDRIAHVSSFAFAGSVPAVFGALVSGATLEAFDLRGRGVGAFAGWAAARGITVLPCVASVLREVVEARIKAGGSWQPRRIIVGSEVLHRADMLAIRQRLGWSCAVVNRLASSEAGMIAEWEVDLAAFEGDDVPVGRPVEDRTITILDEDGTPAPHGVAGEILVGGDYTAIGYWQRADLTQERFRPDPAVQGRWQFASGDLGRFNESGMLEYLGRVDHMVKVRGFRVELGAIEAALRALPGVGEAVVQAGRTASKDVRLSAWVQRTEGARITGVELRRQLRTQLPDYMVPWRIGIFDALPRTSGGKLARGSMPKLAGPRPDGMPPFVPPRGPTEELLAAIWRDLFEVDDIGRDDDFRELGGDSLDLLQVTAVLYEQREIFITDADLVEHPRLADMAAVVDRAG